MKEYGVVDSAFPPGYIWKRTMIQPPYEEMKVGAESEVYEKDGRWYWQARSRPEGFETADEAWADFYSNPLFQRGEA